MGNPTSYLGAALTWEGKRLVNADYSSLIGGRTGHYAYSYNEDGLRLSKNIDGTTTEYYYNGSVLIGMKIGTGSTAKILCFSYDASGNVVAVDYSTNNGSTFNSYFYLRNAQNDIVKILDNTGTTVVEYIYDSWGKILSATGTLANTVGLYQPFRYRGYVYDTETGWYYLQSRYYDPTTCRFISADVLLSTGQGVIGHNSFAYCLNNPIAFTDLDGKKASKWELLPYKGFIHRAVQLHIKMKAKEAGVNLLTETTVRVGWFKGRVDLFDPDTGRIWEIKPQGSALLGAAQLCWYSAGK